MACIKNFLNNNCYDNVTGARCYDCAGETLRYPSVLNTPSVIDVAQIPSIPTISATPLPFPKSTPTTTLDKALATALSALALLKGAPKIPTAEQEAQFIPINYGNTGALGNTMAVGDGTAAGTVEVWIKNNTGVVLIGAAVIGAYLLKSPRQRRNGLNKLYKRFA